LETNSASDVSMFNQNSMAVLADAELEEKQEVQQWCTPFSAMKNRSYYFELLYPDGERTAMHLHRDPKNPRISIYTGRTWSVRFANFTSGRQGLSWRPVVADSEGRPVSDERGRIHSDYSNSLEIDVRKDIAYIKRIPASAQENSFDGIEFGFLNGTKMSFAGGLYYPQAAMTRSLKAAFEQRKMEEDQYRNGIVRSHRRNAEESELDAAGGQKVVNGATELVESLWTNAKFSAAFAFLFTVTPAAFAAATGPSVYSMAAAWAVVSSATVHATVWALPILVPISLYSTISGWRHERRELSMSASEKLFEKLSCHRMIGVCDGADLKGQDSVSILNFAGRPDGDVLVPFNGDVDVLTGKKFPRKVSWNTPINNEGNIRCTDEVLLR